ncbi:transcription factor Opi1-domain-containing protein [Chlamydoabsidia padenii]|nr:transcription factor Opi1-domain-containing protein [Chlamydoabsidia padenii]
MHDFDSHGTKRRTNKSYGGSRSTSPLNPYTKPSYPKRNQYHRPPSTTAWQQLVVGASSAAGTTAAVVSEESMKCMKYCLYWLQYAMQHIEQQMGLIRTFLVSLATTQSSPSSPSSSLSVPTTSSVLSTVKKDVVDTLRKVVDIISRYAGSSLPYHAKMTVRGFILNLPGRWASLNDIRSTTTSPMASPRLSARMDQQDFERPKEEETALRLLNFGQESVDMLHSISSIFSETVERAELWIDRLRLRPPESNLEDQPIQLPSIHTLDQTLQHSYGLPADMHHQRQKQMDIIE